MVFRLSWRSSAMVLACIPLCSTTAHALLKFNDGRDKIFASGTIAVGYDSNIFSSEEAQGDTITTSSLKVEYLRRAGMIGVTGEVAWTRGDFTSNAAESFSDPTLSLELVKDAGRTTGSFTLSGGRQTKADPLLNQRTASWNYNLGLNWKYPIIERYNVAGSVGYGGITYTEKSSDLVDLKTKTASVDTFYRYTSQRDLVAGYRIRQSDTSADNQSIDHALTAGVSGKIISKLKGNVRAGYQIRQEGSSGETLGSTTASASVSWPVNKRFTLTGTLNKDFSTTGKESSVDNLTFNLDAQYVLRNRWSLYAGAGTGNSDFINGEATGRSDLFITGNLGLGYDLSDRFKASLSYSYFKNWSNRVTSNFVRNTVTLSVSSRW